MDIHSISTHCTRTEFVGTAVLDTIGLVISGIDDTLLSQMNLEKPYHTLGLLSSRTGAAGQITAVDDAVKATDTHVLSIATNLKSVSLSTTLSCVRSAATPIPSAAWLSCTCAGGSASRPRKWPPGPCRATPSSPKPCRSWKSSDTDAGMRIKTTLVNADYLG